MSFCQPRKLGPLATAAVLLVLGSNPASAQYFGRNKVNYRTFDFDILKTEHFDVYYYSEESDAIPTAARMAERWYTRLSRVLNHELAGRQPLIMYASHPHFEQTNAIQGDLDESTGGVTESVKRRIVLPFSGSLAETDHVVGHELVHAFQYDIMGRSRVGGSVAMRMPLWFIEGMAEYLTIGPIDPHTSMWMRDAVRSGKELPDLAHLAEYRYFPYRWGHSLWSYVGERWGDRAIGELLKAVSRGIEMEQAFSAVLGVPTDSLARDWHRALRAQSDRVGGQPPTALVKPLIGSTGDRGVYNLAPSLSPDGRQVMFLSERDLFSIELYLADAHTGRISRRVTRTAVDPHLQSLQFVSGAGSWSPDNRQFAFATVRNGRSAIQVIDVASGQTRRQYSVREIGEIWTLSWSPDGRSIAFSALAGGHTDLFSIDLHSGSVRRWTNDLPADLQPAWSPDGKSIAFITERFAPIENLSHGHLRLALLDIPDGSVHLLPSLPNSKHLNPQWSPDGRALYCIAAPGGIPNLVRLELESQTWTQITNVGTGVSGLTATSPAISVSRTGDRMVFAAYENGAYSIFALDSLSTRGQPLVFGADSLAAWILPPDYPDFAVTNTVRALPESLDIGLPPAGEQALNDPNDVQDPPFAGSPSYARSAPTDTVDFRTRMQPITSERGEVQSMLEDPEEGLVDTTGFEQTGYRPSLSLDKVSQVGIGFGVGGGSVSGGGGATLYWSDMLGDHNLATYLEISSDGGNFLNNVAAVLDYRNLRRRWNWGVELSQVPYLTRGLEYNVVQLPDGSQGTQEDVALIWQVERRALGTVAYPFDRIRRIEFAGGFRSVGFESELTTRLYDGSGRLVSETTGGFYADPEALDMGVGIVALVHDNSLFGGTSPVLGSRGRIELDVYAGDLVYNSFLLDLRHYVMPMRPLTLAGRALTFGRYGPDAESPLMSSLFLGYPSLVRGYDQESFRVSECEDPTGFGPCESWDRLFGSRLAVANVEARLPVFGPLGVLRSAMMPPVELAAFFDVGSAWGMGDDPTYRNGQQNVVSSHGVAMRMNLFGFLIAEMDLVHPNDRPQKGWYWQFSFQPGF